MVELRGVEPLSKYRLLNPSFTCLVYISCFHPLKTYKQISQRLFCLKFHLSTNRRIKRSRLSIIDQHYTIISTESRFGYMIKDQAARAKFSSSTIICLVDYLRGQRPSSTCRINKTYTCRNQIQPQFQ